MRLSALLAAACLASLALAGCSDGGGDGDGTSSTSTSTSRSGTSTVTSTGTSTPGTSTATSTSSTSTSTGPGGPQNRAPTGSVSVTVNGSRAAFALNGTDLDGDVVTWSLDLGDGNATNGTTLPATVTHTYPNGNYSLNYTLRDEDGATASYALNLTVNATGSAGPIQVASVGYAAGGEFGCGAEYDPFPGPGLPASGVLYGEIAVDPATIGGPYVLDLSWTEGALPVFADIAFYGADDALLGGNLVEGAPPLLLEGTVPAGATYAIVTMCDPGAGEATGQYAAG